MVAAYYNETLINFLKLLYTYKCRYRNKFVQHVSGITFIKQTHNQEIQKPNNLNVFVRKYTKGHTKYNQIRLRSPMPGVCVMEDNFQKVLFLVLLQLMYLFPKHIGKMANITI